MFEFLENGMKNTFKLLIDFKLHIIYYFNYFVLIRKDYEFTKVFTQIQSTVSSRAAKKCSVITPK
jgi:hypothetical protein